MKITVKRSLEIARNLEGLIGNVNAISEEELEEYIRIGDTQLAIGPMLDPTMWRDNNLFGAYHKTQVVFRALRDFKRIVKGIGKFA